MRDKVMNYWFCITNEENWKVVKERKVWGVPKRDRRQIESVKSGDYLVFYVMPQRIAGVFKATSEPFESDEKIFSWAEFGRYELFPHRVKIEPMIILERGIQFKDLIRKSRFITYKKRWSVHLRRAMRIIPKQDYDLIFNAIEGAT